MRLLPRWTLMVALFAFGIASLSGCVVEERRDGGVTVRPVHIE